MRKVTRALWRGRRKRRSDSPVRLISPTDRSDQSNPSDWRVRPTFSSRPTFLWTSTQIRHHPIRLVDRFLKLVHVDDDAYERRVFVVVGEDEERDAVFADGAGVDHRDFAVAIRVRLNDRLKRLAGIA